MLHHIQKSLIERLGFYESLRYSELKPKELDGNVFGYHLKQAIRDEYVHRVDDATYSLTSKGRDFFVHRFEDPAASAHSIFLVVIKNKNSYLMRRRKVQPLLGRVGFIHGEPVPGVSIEETASLRVKEKTGINVRPRVRAAALISQFQADELVSYSHAVILYAETTDELQISEDATGENFWSDDMSQKEVLPSCRDIIALLDADESWGDFTYSL